MERYERLKVLGVGSFGKVYLMRHRQQRRLVCAKIIKIKNIPRKEREACRTEVDLMRRLHHPNIVGYKDSFLTPRKDHLCIVMEYCDGGDLSTQIKNARRRLFPESKILHWFVQIALGLHYMHDRLVLHRDLKTQNIFLLGNGRLVLGDLGISKVLEGTMDFASTRIGTPYYMSPELFNNKPYNHKSDIWALGCVLYEMAALTHAFDATSLHGLASRVAKGRYPSIHVKYSRNLRDLISRMLSTSPAHRPDLDQILQQDFIKTHIHNFLADIVSRESHKIGEGTMVLKAAAVNLLADAEGSPSSTGLDGDGGIAGLGSNQEMLSLKRQMESLGLQDEVKRALNPPEPIKPTDARSAAKVVKEQAGALRREEDRRKAVESALARLRNEREERLRLRHAKERGNQAVPPLPSPPVAAPEPSSGSNVSVPRSNVGWQAGVVGVGMGVASGESSEEIRSGRGAGGADAAAARQVEASAVRRMGGLLGAGGREARQGAAAPPDVPGQSSAAPPRSSRERRRSLEPRERREDLSSNRVPLRAQNQRRNSGGEARNASPAIGSSGSAGSPAAGGGRGGGGRARNNESDQPDEPRKKDAVPKFGRAKEAGRLAAEAMQRREEASAREAARKRGESFQRDSNRLRQDKVELDRKMKEREQQRRQRAAEAAIKAAAADTNEKPEKPPQTLPDSAHCQEAAAGAPSPPLPVDSTPGQAKELSVAAVAAVAHSLGSAVAAANVAPVANSERPRLRARWAHANIPGHHESPKVVPPATSSAMESIQRQKREKARLEEDINRKEEALRQAENDGRGRGAPLLPPPPPIVAKDPGGKKRSGARSSPSLASEPVESVEDSLSPCSSGSEDSEDSDSVLWNSGGGRGNRGRGRGRSVAAAGKGQRQQGSEVKGASRVASDVAVRGGEGGGEGEGRGEGSENDDEDGDEADEDIHAREELLEVELQAATTRCKELRHNLQETKSLIPTEPALIVGDGNGEGGDDGSRYDSLSRRNNPAAAAAAPSTTGADATRHRRPPRPGPAHAEDPRDDEEEEEEEDENEPVDANIKGANERPPPVMRAGWVFPHPGLVDANERGTNDRTPPLVTRAGGDVVARPSQNNLQGGIFKGGGGGASNNDEQGRRHRDEAERCTGREGRVRRAWGDPDEGGGAAAVGLPAGAAAVGGQQRQSASDGAGGAVGGQRRMVYYGGGGVEDGRAVQVVGGASDSSSEESRNSYYPYDQGQLEIEAKALSGNGTVGNDAQPKPLQRPASFRDRPSPAYPSPAAPVSSGGVDKGRGTGRESKRLSRQTPASSSAGDVFARGGAQARSASDVLGRGRPQARSVNDVLAREAPQEPSASDVLAHGRPPKQSSGNGVFARGRSQERQSNVGLAAAARAPRAEFSPSPPPSAPAGRLADRIRTLRERCCLGLGEGTFERAYRYLKAQEESDALAWGAEVAVEEDREERLVRELTDILGQNKVHYYSLIDQLIFIENTLTGPA